MSSKLRLWLKAEGLTMEEFGRRIGTTNVTVSRMCSGVQIPGRELMRRVFFETGGAIQPNDFYDLTARDEAKAA
jgi:transcriptional regulator with XRE-family HTH domain